MEANDRNEFSRNIVKSLRAYYDREGIFPNRIKSTLFFHCSRKDLCPDLKKDKLARGMQCHVGYNYGETIKIVVSALDCGYGGADEIEMRTLNVKNDHKSIHMRGTLKAVSFILGKLPKKYVDYIAMINACKCCRKYKSNHLPLKYYENCSVHKLEEYRILKPDIILFQGKKELSRAGCESCLSKIEDPELDTDLKKYVNMYSDGVIECFAVTCIHPSARGRSFVKRQKFYDEIFPRIAEYLRKKLMEHKEQE
jgi:hypothetical protein